jgi:DNA-binding MarR family transcriptional regulator
VRGQRGGFWHDRGQESVDLLIGQICRLHHHHMHRTLESLGLYRGQPRLLHVLWEREGITHSELARELHVQPATVTKMLQRMEKAGFLERKHDERDERVSRVYLTTRGREIKDRVEKIIEALSGIVESGFDEAELAALRDSLIRVRNNLMDRENL